MVKDEARRHHGPRFGLDLSMDIGPPAGPPIKERRLDSMLTVYFLYGGVGSGVRCQVSGVRCQVLSVESKDDCFVSQLKAGIVFL